MSIAYRLLGPGDEGVLDRVAEEVFDEPIRPDRLRAYLSEPAHLLLLALDGELVVGQCAAVLHLHADRATELYVEELGVSPAWQRRGIGRELMRRMFDEGRARGCEEGWVGTEPDNVAANALYAGLEGSPVETFHFYHYDFKEPA